MSPSPHGGVTLIMRNFIIMTVKVFHFSLIMAVCKKGFEFLCRKKKANFFADYFKKWNININLNKVF